MVAWFLNPYKRDVDAPHPTRYPAIDDFADVIHADGGNYATTEVLGDYALSKVEAHPATLVALDNQPGFVGIPAARLNDPLSSLTAAQKTRIRNQVLALGYTAQEIQDRVGGDLGAVTLGQLLRFIATRRLTPRYDPDTDQIILDGKVETPLPVEEVDNQL